MTDQVTAAAEPDPQRYNTWLEGLSLSVIEVVAVQAERRRSGPAPATQYQLGAGWSVEENWLFWRYDVTAHLTDDDGTDYGDVQASVLLRGQHRGDDTDPACMERFGATSGTIMAHPYLREVIATTALRLGFVGVMLPMITAQPDVVVAEGQPVNGPEAAE
ncbi:MAG: hypothetical protein JWO60_3131 [Frankiales bacterium]|nr:hypothetical protein [Frankiales bacterium]